MNAKLRCYLVALSLVVLATTPARAFEAFVSVDDYMAAPREARMTFLAGVYDSFGTLQDAGLFSSETLATTVKRIIDCTSPMAIEEIETLFTARLEEDRGDWDTAAVSRFIFAFDDYCS
ncbi:MAG: hypothetical protein QNI94_06560 [Kiloniellales bacterium]|nr:hypothetical protein [Kiloniellales bacterium]